MPGPSGPSGNFLRREPLGRRHPSPPLPVPGGPASRPHAARPGGARPAGATSDQRDRPDLQRRAVPPRVPRQPPGPDLRGFRGRRRRRRLTRRLAGDRGAVRRSRPAHPHRHPAERRAGRGPQHRRPRRPRPLPDLPRLRRRAAAPRARDLAPHRGHDRLGDRRRRHGALRLAAGVDPLVGARRPPLDPAADDRRGAPPPPAQPLHLRQALPSRLLGGAGPLVPRGRGLRGPAARHPAAGAGPLDRPGARRRLPLPRARRPQLDQPADGVPEGPARPDRRLARQP